MTEVAFDVENIDEWFEKVRAAGYETTTDFIWNFGPAARSFLFRDYDGSLIQLCEMTL